MPSSAPASSVSAVSTSSPASRGTPATPSDAAPAGDETDPARLTLAHVTTAARHLAGAIVPTPTHPSRALSAATGAHVWLKRDDLQPTGSFKERGARHALALLAPAARARGVVAASAGNHALGLARHGAALGLPVTLVMPVNASRVKIERCRALGAEVVLAGDTFDAARAHATGLAQAQGRAFIHPFDDFAVMAGQGTLALEALAAAPHATIMLVPVGGGGLLAGVVTVARALRPRMRVIAVEPAHAASFLPAWQRGQVVATETQPTLADGLRVAAVGRHTLAVARDGVDDVVTVTEDEIAAAMLALFEDERATVEGAGATALAALLAGKVRGATGREVIVPITGANVDATTFAHALHRGLAARAAWVRSA